jgi:phosphohistidine phosphatase
MKTLLILRHGKSSWLDPSLDDHDRPLKGRGKRAAKQIGRLIRERDLLPDLIITSTARRARSTARRAAKAAGYDGETVATRELYFSSVGKQLAAIAGHARPGDRRVMIVGHNPTFEELVETLAREEVTLKTADLATVDLAIDDWSELPRARGELRFLVRSRELPGG